VGPFTVKEEVASRVPVVIVDAVRDVFEYTLEAVMELVVRAATLAIVWFSGNPNEFVIFQEVGSRLVIVRKP
jgi:hypothetical protein